MKIKNLVWSIFFALVLLGSFDSKSEPWSEGTLPFCDDMKIPIGSHDTMPSPHTKFNHVKKILIVVEVNAQGYKLPELLEKEKIEDILVSLYKERYTTNEWCTSCAKFKCYGRLNQSIEILSFESVEDKAKATALSLLEENLTVYAFVEMVNPKQVSIKIINYRPNLDQPAWREATKFPLKFWEMKPKSAPTNSIYIFEIDDARITEKISSYFSGKIY